MTNSPVALVTGAARGIGAAIAVELAGNGYDVAVFDVIDSADTVRAVEAAGRKGLSISGDVTTAADRTAALERSRRPSAASTASSTTPASPPRSAPTSSKRPRRATTAS